MVDKNLTLAIPEVLSEGDCKAKYNYCNEGFVDLVVSSVGQVTL